MSTLKKLKKYIMYIHVYTVKPVSCNTEQLKICHRIKVPSGAALVTLIQHFCFFQGIIEIEGYMAVNM